MEIKVGGKTWFENLVYEVITIWSDYNQLALRVRWLFYHFISNSGSWNNCYIFLSLTISRKWSYLLDSNWKRVLEAETSVIKRANTILGSSNWFHSVTDMLRILMYCRYRYEKMQKNMKELGYETTDKQKKGFMSKLYH